MVRYICPQAGHFQSQSLFLAFLCRCSSCACPHLGQDTGWPAQSFFKSNTSSSRLFVNILFLNFKFTLYFNRIVSKSCFQSASRLRRRRFSSLVGRWQWNQIWLRQPDPARLDALPCDNGLFICDIGKLVHQGIIAVFGVPARVGGKNGNGAFPHQRIFVAQQRGEVIEIRIKPAAALPAFCRDNIRIGAGGLCALAGQPRCPATLPAALCVFTLHASDPSSRSLIPPHR